MSDESRDEPESSEETSREDESLPPEEAEAETILQKTPPGSGSSDDLNPDAPTVIQGADDAPGALESSPGADGDSLNVTFVERAVAEGLITRHQGETILSRSRKAEEPALSLMVDSGFIDEGMARELEEGVRGETIPGYRIVGKLGEGGMGVVYKAIHKRLNRTVALKVITPGRAADTQFLRRFEREAQAVARLNHPNIVAAYDCGETDGKVYLALEYVEGTNCAEALAEHGPYSQTRALAMIREAVRGLSHAQAHGIIHRDVKPANLLLSRKRSRDAAGEAVGGWIKVTDLGLARMVERGDEPEEGDMTELTQSGTVLGTPAYMAPEQAGSEGVDFRADIYGLGATLYHLVTGDQPFQASSWMATITKKCTEKIPSPSDRIEGITDDFLRVLDRMMARTPEERYQSYEELLADIDAVLVGEKPATPPVPDEASSLLAPTGEKPERGPAVDEEDAVASEIVSGIQSQVRVPDTEPEPVNKTLLLLFVLVALGLGGWGIWTMALGPPPERPTTVAEQLERTLETLGELPAGERVAELKQTDGTFREGLKELEPANRESLRLRRRKLVTETLTALWKERSEVLRRLHQRGDYRELKRRVEEAEALFRGFEREPPQELRTYKSYAAQALTDGAGQEERRIWGRAISDDVNPVEALKLLEGFEKRFPFSPALDDLQSRREALRKAAPRLTIRRVEPTGARVEIDGEPVSNDFDGRLPRGEHSLTVKAEGYHSLNRTLMHDEDAELSLRLDPKPERTLKAGSTHFPVWTGSLRPWDVVRDWRALIEEAGLGATAARDGVWKTARKGMSRFFGLPAMKEATGWRLTWQMYVSGPCTAELRTHKSPDGECVVVGRTPDEVYFGIRRENELEVLRRKPVEQVDLFTLDWYGDVIEAGVNGERFASCRPDWTVDPEHPVTVAVGPTTDDEEAEARFRDFRLYPTN